MAGVASAEDHKVGPAVAGHAADHLGEQVDPLLLGKAANERHQRPRIGRGMAEPRGQGDLGGVFAGSDVGLAVVTGNQRVGLRVPAAGVDAVDDAREHVGPGGDHALKPAAARG